MIDIRKETAKHLKDEFNIDPNVTALLFDKGVLSIGACRDMLIRVDYQRKAQHGEKQRLKGKIAERYCVSIDTIEKIVCKKFTNNECI